MGLNYHSFNHQDKRLIDVVRPARSSYVGASWYDASSIGYTTSSSGGTVAFPHQNPGFDESQRFSDASLVNLPGKGNFTFYDGHVESVDRKRVPTSLRGGNSGAYSSFFAPWISASSVRYWTDEW